MREPAERPFGVTLIAILLAIEGILALIAAFGAVDTLTLILGVLFGVALLYLAYGVWTLQPWAWTATLIVVGIYAVFSLIAVIMAPGSIGAWISLILAAVIVWYLLQPDVRGAFGRGRAGI